MSYYGSATPTPAPFGGLQAPQVVAATALASWRQRVNAAGYDCALIVGLSLLLGWLGLLVSSEPLVLLTSVLVLPVGAYNRWYRGGQGQSIGRKQMGLTLVSESTGQPIGTANAFLRDLAHIADYASCLIGFLSPLWDQKRQTFADKIMETVVITKA